MGQAFRRATGRIGSSAVDTTSQLRKPIERPPPPPPPPPPPSSIPVEKHPTDEITHVSGIFLFNFIWFVEVDFPIFSSSLFLSEDFDLWSWNFECVVMFDENIICGIKLKCLFFSMYYEKNLAWGGLQNDWMWWTLPIPRASNLCNFLLIEYIFVIMVLVLKWISAKILKHTLSSTRRT